MRKKANTKKRINYKKFYKDKSFYKKQLNRLIAVIIILIILMLMKKINTKFTNDVIRIVNENINYEFSFKEDGKKMLEKSKVALKLPEKIISVFKFNDDKGGVVLPVEGKVYKPFGELKNSKGKYNQGIDIIPENGNNISSIGDGVVKSIEEKNSQGYYVMIKYDDYEAIYGHLNEVDISVGDTVSKGEKIGSLGDFSGGNRYLHFEIWKDGSPINPIDVVRLN